jgi:hypothetical protein
LVTHPGAKFGIGVTREWHTTHSCRPAPRAYCYTRHMSVSLFGRICICLNAVVLSLVILPTASSSQNATGHFEVYCDGVGFFLAKVDGAPAPGKLFLFLYTGFPGTPYVPKETWQDVYVYRDGCIADGKCEVLAHGKVWLDDVPMPDARRVSGKYEIELNGQHFRGQFAAKRHDYKHPPRLCM